MDALKIAQKYFDLSNESNFEGIANLFTDQTIYISQNTGKYIGRDNILAMQKDFHGSFKSKQWEINGIKEVVPNLVLIDYTFSGKKTDGTKVGGSGLEYITVK